MLQNIVLTIFFNYSIIYINKRCTFVVRKCIDIFNKTNTKYKYIKPQTTQTTQTK
jgi:hypothetical protein